MLRNTIHGTSRAIIEWSPRDPGSEYWYFPRPGTAEPDLQAGGGAERARGGTAK